MAVASDYGLGPHTFPRGWFVVAESAELNQGPRAVRFLAAISRCIEGRVARRYCWMPTAVTWEPISPPAIQQ